MFSIGPAVTGWL